MPGIQFISSKVHGLLDYPLGVVLLLTPNLFGFADLGGAAVWLPRVLGAFVMVEALVTNYELSLIKLMPFDLHVVLDFLMGGLLLLSPWLFGFSNDPYHVWFPPVILAIIELSIVLLTHPHREITTRRA